jgi:hypothetical protein
MCRRRCLAALTLAGLVGALTASSASASVSPTNLTLTPGVEKLMLSWGVNSTEGLGGFLGRWRAAATSTWSTAELPATARSYTITGLKSPTSYEVQVQALVVSGTASATGTPTAQPAPQTSWAAVGAPPLTDAQAASLVTHKPEQRPANTTANDYVPTNAQLEAFHLAARASDPLSPYVDGRDGLKAPSTDDLIQWAAHKWGIPEDWLRAQYVQESYWRQSTLGDRSGVPLSWYVLYPLVAQIPSSSEVYESMGISQVKWKPDGSQAPGTEPLRWLSTAFNIDYEASIVRYYYDGYCSWCTSGYTAGQQWNSIGAWFEPYPWGNSMQLAYERRVQERLAEKPWLSTTF